MLDGPDGAQAQYIMMMKTSDQNQIERRTKAADSTVAPKVAKAQTEMTTSPISGLARESSTAAGHQSDHSWAEQVLFLQRTVGNQATLQLLAQRSSGPMDSEVTDDHEDRANPENMMVRKAARSAPWDFGKVPSYPHDWASQHQPPAPLPGALQTKLVIGQANDPLEDDAERVANQVMRMPDPEFATGATPSQVSRECAAREGREQKTLQLKPSGPAKVDCDEAPATVQEAIYSPGQPLDPSTRAFMEPRFGYDFSHVRVHSGPDAAASANTIGALAYAVGHDLVFAEGRYAPQEGPGRRLLAHELVHVVQQAGGASGRVPVQAAPRGLQRAVKTLGGSVSAGNSEWGFHYKDAAGRLKHQDATLYDRPELPGHGPNSSQLFETVALAVEGPQAGTSYGSVCWGWQADGSNTVKKEPLSVVATGVPSAAFRQSADLWNASTTPSGDPVVNLPAMHALQPKPGTEAAEVEKALAANDYATAYQIINGRWIKPMLPTLSQLNKKGLLPNLYSNTDKAVGVDTPRLRVAIEAVQFKENKVPLSQEFMDWIDPAKNNRTGEINEIKTLIGMK